MGRRFPGVATGVVRMKIIPFGRPQIQREFMNDSENIRILHELIAALDRRLPQIQRAGEASIARDAAALKASALERVAKLEQGQTSG